MKTAISVPNGEFNRYERVAARHGMNRSEFYSRAARRYADELEGGSDLTIRANEALAAAGQPTDELFLRESERLIQNENTW